MRSLVRIIIVVHLQLIFITCNHLPTSGIEGNYYFIDNFNEYVEVYIHNGQIYYQDLSMGLISPQRYFIDKDKLFIYNVYTSDTVMYTFKKDNHYLYLTDSTNHIYTHYKLSCGINYIKKYENGLYTVDSLNQHYLKRYLLFKENKLE